MIEADDVSSVELVSPELNAFVELAANFSSNTTGEAALVGERARRHVKGLERKSNDFRRASSVFEDFRRKEIEDLKRRLNLSQWTNSNLLKNIQQCASNYIANEYEEIASSVKEILEKAEVEIEYQEALDEMLKSLEPKI